MRSMGIWLGNTGGTGEARWHSVPTAAGSFAEMVSRMSRSALLGAVFALAGASTSLAAGVSPPEDPTQSITYWKPFSIRPEDDPKVELAHEVFGRLLRSWDSTRIPPRLYVVHSQGGPWAASLDDGTILLSREAIETCLKGGAGGMDRLAFVLAHELAHQRANDLWHRRFFLLSGTQAPAVRERLLHGLSAERLELLSLQEKEVRADRDGLTLMAVGGYDPEAVVDGDDFFTSWVESIWQGPCTAGKATANHGACEQAQQRVAQARVRLREVANQTALFEMGLQSYVAERFEDARSYFVAFGREFPGKAVHHNIGLTYLAQALAIRDELEAASVGDAPPLFFPLAIESDTGFVRPASAPRTRGAETSEMPPRVSPAQATAERRRMRELAGRAVEAFERAIKLGLENRPGYLHLTAAYLVSGNPPMARGILEGKYRRAFGSDPGFRLYSSLVVASEGDLAAARQRLEVLASEEMPAGLDPEAELYRFAVYRNLVVLSEAMGSPGVVRDVWHRLARAAQSTGNARLFRLALAQLKGEASSGQPVVVEPAFREFTLGHTLPSIPALEQQAIRGELWLEGERLQLYRLPDGGRLLVDSRNRVVSGWQEGGFSSARGGIAIGDNTDRLLKVHGLPTRSVPTTRGEYVAYDALGLAFRAVGGRVVGWFAYRTDD